MLIVITLPHYFDGEAEAIVRLFEERHIDRLHLRKPETSIEQLEQLLEQIPRRYYPRITLHDWYEVAQRYGLGGIHLTGRHPEAPAGWRGLVSTSCHSIAELVRRRRESFDYLSLSPIFDSISKMGYKAAFTLEELAQARRDGVIDRRVMALGGVTFERMPEVLDLGFGGGMILGDAWNHYKGMERE